MKGFIEVTYLRTGDKYTINVNQIVFFCALNDSDMSSLILNDGARFTVGESYDEIKAKIEKAVQ